MLGVLWGCCELRRGEDDEACYVRRGTPQDTEGHESLSPTKTPTRSLNPRRSSCDARVHFTRRTLVRMRSEARFRPHNRIPHPQLHHFQPSPAIVWPRNSRVRNSLEADPLTNFARDRSLPCPATPRVPSPTPPNPIRDRARPCAPLHLARIRPPGRPTSPPDSDVAKKRRAPALHPRRPHHRTPEHHHTPEPPHSPRRPPRRHSSQ
jgi:hypothetical protein